MEKFTPLNAEERAIIKQAVSEINSTIAIPCTGCGYCVEGCPGIFRFRHIFHCIIWKSRQNPRDFRFRACIMKTIRRRMEKHPIVLAAKTANASARSTWKLWKAFVMWQSFE